MEKLDPAHYEVRLSPAKRQTVRLWLDAGAPYPGTYAALGTGMIGGYQQNQQTLENDADWPETRAAQDVFARRCAACHQEKQRPIPRSFSDEIGLRICSAGNRPRSLPRPAPEMVNYLAFHHVGREPVYHGAVRRMTRS
jgi:hypothetical protein